MKQIISRKEGVSKTSNPQRLYAEHLKNNDDKV
jgi:hypothetical protein